MKRVFEAYSIVGIYGNFWCNETFKSEYDARKFFRKNCSDGSGFSIVPVRVEISLQIDKPATFKTGVPIVKESSK